MPRIIEHPEVATLADTDKILADTPGGGTHSISVGNLKKIFGEDETEKPIPPATEIDWNALTNFADTAGLLPSDMMLLAGVIAASDIETQSLNYEILWKDVQTRLLGKNSGYILDSGENIQANTMAGRIAGALGAKQLYSTLLDKLGGNSLTYNESEDAYYIQHGADAVPKKLGNDGVKMVNVGAFYGSAEATFNMNNIISDSDIVRSLTIANFGLYNITITRRGTDLSYGYSGIPAPSRYTQSTGILTVPPMWCRAGGNEFLISGNIRCFY